MLIWKLRVGFCNRGSVMWRAAVVGVILVCAVAGEAQASLRLDDYDLKATVGIQRGGGNPFQYTWPKDPELTLHAYENDRYWHAQDEKDRPNTKSVSVSTLIDDDWDAEPVEAMAYQTMSGWDGAEARAGNGAFGSYAVMAEAKGGFGLENRGTEPIPLTLGFLINRAALGLETSNFVTRGEKFARARLDVSISTYGTSWYWSAEIANRNSVWDAPYTTPTVIDPQGIGMPTVRSNEGGLGFRSVIFNPFVGHLDLGVVGPGEGRDLTYRLTARVFTGDHDYVNFPPSEGFEPRMRVEAFIEDPFGFESGAFTINGQPLSSLIVPEPASGLILAGVLGGLAIRRPRAAAR